MQKKKVPAWVLASLQWNPFGPGMIVAEAARCSIYEARIGDTQWIDPCTSGKAFPPKYWYLPTLTFRTTLHVPGTCHQRLGGNQACTS